MEELIKSIQRLSLPPEQALSSIPDETLKIDELALDYDNYFNAAISNFRDEFTFEQLELLNSLNEKLNAISGSDNREIWTEKSFISDNVWENIRGIAKAALKSLN